LQSQGYDHRDNKPAERNERLKALTPNNERNFAEDGQRHERDDPVQNNKDEVEGRLEHVEDFLLPWGAQLPNCETEGDSNDDDADHVVLDERADKTRRNVV